MFWERTDVYNHFELLRASHLYILASLAANFLEGLTEHCLCAIGSVSCIQGGCPFSNASRMITAFFTDAFLATLERYIGVINSFATMRNLSSQFGSSVFVSVRFLVDDFVVENQSQNALSVILFVAVAAIFYFNVRIHFTFRRQRQHVRAQQQAMLQFTAANKKRHRFRGAKTVFFLIYLRN